MDLKRFGLFLILSWAILIGFAMLQGPQPEKDQNPSQSPSTAQTDQTAGQAGGQAGGQTPDANPAVPGGQTPAPGAGATGMSAAETEAEPWSESFTVGVPGETGSYRVRFDSLGGVLAEMRIGNYYISGDPELDRQDPENWMPLVKAVMTERGWTGSMSLRAGPSARDLVPYDLEKVHWDHEVLSDGENVSGVRFFHTVAQSGVLLEKTMRVVPGQYQWDIEFAISGSEATGSGRMARFEMSPAVGLVRASSDPYYVEPKARACGGEKRDFDLETKSFSGDASTLTGSFGIGKTVAYAGVDNKYFTMLIRPGEGGDGDLAQEAMQDANWRIEKDLDWAAKNPAEAREEPYRHIVTDVGMALTVPVQGARLAYPFRLYAGPKKSDVFSAIHPAHETLLREDLGFFDGIGTFLLKTLRFFHGIAGNWGIAIILLTLTVRMALFPFNRRSQTAMAKHATKMKRVQPKITEIKEKYKNDPRKLREAQAKIMQEEGAFPPLGGCLPPLVQIPIFFGLFSALRVAFDLRQERFLWIEDLSMPDRLAHLGLNTHLPIIGTIDWLNILPILMVVLWVTQQKVMPKPSDPQAQQMHKMMMWMPILFGVFLYNYSAGLSLYMVTSSAFGIFEYTIVRKIWPLDETEAPKKTKGKFASRWGEMMKEAQKMQEQKRKAGGGPSAGGKKRKR